MMLRSKQLKTQFYMQLMLHLKAPLKENSKNQKLKNSLQLRNLLRLQFFHLQT